jgi:glycosyltransferase involved in cell wall biosynthesis
MALSPSFWRAERLRLRILLWAEEVVPQWLGALLSELERVDGVALQVLRLGHAEPPVRPSLSARFWQGRLPPLMPWVMDAAARELLVRWESAASEACDISLVLDANRLSVSGGSGTGLQWAIVDGGDRTLCPRFPFLDSICTGTGLPLRLLQREGNSGAWQTVRRLHVAAPQSYDQALLGLKEAVLRLLRQAVVDWRLGGIMPTGQAGSACSISACAQLDSPGMTIALGQLRHLRKRLREQLFGEYWRIGVIDVPIDSFLRDGELPKVCWLVPDKVSGYWADPFPLPGDPDRLTCEYFDQRSGLGSLEVLGFDRESRLIERRKLAVGLGRHASFPNILEVGGRCFGVAETAGRRECVLHEVDAGGAWHPLYPLLNDVAAADPALFVWEGRWWLAFTDCDLGELDNLCLCFADSLDGPWTQHANNPVKVDTAGARMAGAFFWHDGALYRPGQDCLAWYGASIVMHRIVRLTPTCFEEVAVRRLQPDRQGACPDGLHTINAWGSRTLIDGKRHGVNLLVLGRNLRNRWRRCQRRLLSSLSRPAMAGGVASRPRVLVYIPHLRVGGGEISMWRLAEGLAATGFDVCIVAHSETTNELGIPAGVSFASLDCGSTLSAIWRLSRVLRQRRPHWLLSAFPHTNVGAVAALALSGQTTRCIISEHAPLSHQITQQANWRYRLLPSLVRWAYRRAHAVIGVSAGVRDDLQVLLGPGVTPRVINNPVLSSGFEAEMALPVDNAWLLDENLRVVLSVCRLSVEKDLPTLVRAFAVVHRQRPETRLLLAGEGPDRERVQALVEEMGLVDVVRLPGRITTPLAWMRRAAVFVLASRYEGFGNVLIEAMACGTPVVSTDCPVGPREILDGGRLGQLVPVGDVPAMASAIVLALDRPPPPAARESALRHTQARACADYRQLFESLCRDGMPC